MASPNASSIVKFTSTGRKLNRSKGDILLTTDNNMLISGQEVSVPISLPLSLVISWTAFFGFMSTHLSHSSNSPGASQAYIGAHIISSIMGALAGIGLLVYYFIHVAWYWPILLFVLGTFIGRILFGFLEGMIGLREMNLVSFIGWPAAAIWSFFIIRDLHP